MLIVFRFLFKSQVSPLATPPGPTHLHCAGVVGAIQQSDPALHGVSGESLL